MQIYKFGNIALETYEKKTKKEEYRNLKLQKSKLFSPSEDRVKFCSFSNIYRKKIRMYIYIYIYRWNYLVIIE